MIKSTTQILIDARQSIIDNGMHKGSLVSYKEDNRSLCFCALGHIASAAGFPIQKEDDDVSFIPMRCDVSIYRELDELEAVQILAQQVNPEYAHRPTYAVYEFNDSALDDDTIIAAFDKAIESSQSN
jgi:hypothetical protein